MELQAITALKHLADAIVFMVDPSETCGYPLNSQVNLYREILGEFKDVPILKVLNKMDIASQSQVEEAKKGLSGDLFEAVSSQKKGTEEIFETALKLALA